MSDLPAPSLITLAELFRARLFRIDPWPVASAWDTPQIAAFTADLAASTPETPHFLGTLVVVPDGPAQSSGGGLRFERWAVHDGRHRLMTAVAWIRAAVEGLEGIDGTDGPMLASVLQRRYIDVDGCARVEVEAAQHQAFMSLAENFHRADLACDDLTAEDRFTRLIRPVERIEHSLRFLLYPVASGAHANAFVETSRTRGRQD